MYLQADSIIYVNDNNTAGPWTGTRTHPFQNIPEGLALADSGVTVFVLPGIYQISSDLLVGNGVNLFLDTNITIRFGVNAGMNVNGHLLAFGARNDSIVFTSTANGTTWKGIRFMNARDSELRYCKIENCTGTADGKGGALYAKNCAPTFFKCRIQNNSAIYGGGIFCDSLAKPLIKECVIANNNAVSGGGIFSNYAQPMIVDNLIANNHTTGRMGGGGIAIYNQTVLSPATMQPLLAGNVQPDPLPLHTGGLLSNVQYSQQPNPEETCSFTNSGRTFPVVMGNTISGNTSAFSGGGIVLDNNESVIYDNAINTNTANQDGGGICSKSNSTYLIKWNEISDNQAMRYGGGLFSVRCDSSELSRNLLVSNNALKGGAVFLDSCNLDFYNNTVSANNSPQGGAGLYNNNGVIQAFNNIFWKNLPVDGTSLMGSDIIASYNDIENGFPGPWNFSVDPVFVDTTSRNFNLRFSSPCINTGKPGSEPDPDSTNADRGVFYNPTNIGSAMIGYYSINNAPGSTADYSSFNAAVSDLISRHVAGPVTFQVSPGTYTEQVRIPEIVGASLNNPVEFNSLNQDSTSVILTYASTTSALNYTLKFDSADHITFRQMTIKATGTTYGRVIGILNGANYNKILNCRIIGVQNTNTSSDFALVFSSGNNDNSNQFISNELLFGSYGLFFNGVSSSSLESGTQIKLNRFTDQYYRGINLQNQNAPVISQNTITSASGYIYYYAVSCTYCDNALNFTENKIRIGSGRGADFSSCYGTSAAPGLIANNFIQSGNYESCLLIQYCSYQNVYFNSINKTGSQSGTSALYISSGSYFNIKNNILVNYGGGYALLLYGSNLECNYNDLYTTGLILANNGSNDFSDLKAWQSYTGHDINSLSREPGFVSSSDLHIISNPYLNNHAEPIAIISVDIDGDPRNPGNPDIGADEFKLEGLDASIVWHSPVSPVVPGNKTISVIIENTGATTIQSLVIKYSDQISTWSESLTNLNLISENRDTITFQQSYLLSNTAILHAYISLVNGLPDGHRDNDTTVWQFLSQPLNGTYTINPAAATAGTNFRNFSDAAQALSSCGVSGPVTFLVSPGTYTEQITIFAVNGASAANRITFQSSNNDSSSVILSWNSTLLSYNYTLRLAGANYIEFKKMTLKATNNTYGRVISLSSTATHNIFTGNQIIGIQNTNTGNNYALVYSSGSNDNETVFESNLLKYGSYGILFNGVSGSSLESGTQIKQNRFVDQYYRGIYLQYQNAPLISQNTITSASGYIYYYAVSCTYCDNALNFTGNKISIGSGRGADFSSCYGTSAAPGLIANNFIQSGNYESCMLIQYCSYQNVYFNSINKTGPQSGTSALYIYSGSYFNIKNNILANNGGGYALLLYGSNVVCNYNDLYTTGLILANNGSYDFSDLKAWQSNTGNDIYSLSKEPGFVTSTDLHILSNPYLNKYADPIDAISEDIDGDPRNPVNPDIGADEFNLEGIDASIAWLSPVSPAEPGNKTITVIVENTGATTIQSLMIKYSDQVGTWSETLTNLNLISENRDTITLQQNYFLSNIASLHAYISLVNGIQDEHRYNDTTEWQMLCQPLNGTYTINPAMMTAGINFKNFSDAAQALSSCGVSGPVTFQVSPGTYPEQITISAVNGASPTNRITFQSSNNDSSSVILSWNSTLLSYNYTLRLDGADFIEFKQITFKAIGTSYGRVITLSNTSNQNKFTGNQIIGTQTTNTGNDYALVYSSGSNDNETVFESNLFTYGSYGILFNGVSGSSLESGTQIKRNRFTDQYYRGIFLQYQNAPVISQNTITSASGYIYYYAVSCTYCDNVLHFTGNKISVVSGRGADFSSCYGTSAEPGLIANNFIQSGNYENCLQLYYCSYQNVYYNSLNKTGTQSGTSALNIWGGNYIDIKNNIIANNAGGYSLTIYGSNVTIDYNDLFTTGTVLVYNPGYGYTYNNLASWGLASGQDLHSISKQPMFISSSDLHIMADTSLASAGIPINGILSDIDGENRDPLSPDIGADEFKQAAFVTTANINQITFSSANSGGVVTVSGSSPVTARGVCWATTLYPQVTGSHTIDGSGLGSFVSQITGLSPNTIYFVRAYATNISGTYYGSTLQFKTPCSVISQFPWTEGFENAGQIPECWTQEQINNSGINWIFNNGSGNGNPSSAHGGIYNACLKDFTAGSNKTRLISPPLNLTMISEPELTFWHTQTAWSSDQDHLSVYYKISEGGTWNLLSTYTNNIPSWTQETISLPNPSSNYFIAFEGNAKYGYGVCIDDISVTGSVAGTPIVITSPISGITNTSAISGGNVTSTGTALVLTRGVCWNTGNNPTIQDSHTVNGSGTGTFISNISGLAINTTYYIRAYATNSIGTSYGDILSFTTPVIPSLQASNILIASSVAPTMTFNWTDGNGAKRAVFMKQDTTGTPLPSGLVSYTASTVFGSGTQIGTSGWYCVFNGTTHAGGVTVTNLTANTRYRIMVCEYNEISGIRYFNTSTAINNPRNQSTCPVITPTITGVATACLATSNQPYSTQTGMSNYTWSVTGGTITAGAGTAAITVTWASSGAKTVCVSYTASSGCQSVQTCKNVNVLANPGDAGTITGTSSVCLGATEVPFSVATIPNATYYQWTVPEGCTIATGANTRSITLNFPNSAGNGSMTVKGVNQCASGASSAHSVAINPELTGILNLMNMNILPGRDLCFSGDNITTGGSGTSFIIQNTGKATLIADTYVKLLTGTKTMPGGKLHAIATIYCIPCATSKAVISLAQTGENDEIQPSPGLSNDPFFRVFPNPTTGEFTLEILDFTESPLTSLIRIHSMLGEEVLREEWKGKSMDNISLKEKPGGIYLVTLLCGEKMGTVKIVKR